MALLFLTCSPISRSWVLLLILSYLMLKLWSLVIFPQSWDLRRTWLAAGLKSVFLFFTLQLLILLPHMIYAIESKSFWEPTEHFLGYWGYCLKLELIWVDLSIESSCWRIFSFWSILSLNETCLFTGGSSNFYEFWLTSMCLTFGFITSWGDPSPIIFVYCFSINSSSQSFCFLKPPLISLILDSESSSDLRCWIFWGSP